MRLPIKIILSLLPIFSVLQLSAQVQLRVFFERDTVMLGDTVGLHYQLLVLPGTEVTAVDLTPLDSVFTTEQMQAAIADTTINWEEVFDSESQFEILNFGRWTPSEANGVIPATGLRWQETPGSQSGQRILSNRVTAVFWDEGTFVVPYPKIGYRSGTRPGLYTPPGAANQVTVKAPTVLEISGTDTLTQLTPIKPIWEEKRNWRDYMWLYLTIGVLIIGYFLYRYLTREEEEIIEEEPEIILPAHVIALQKLEQIKAEELWQKGEVKEYHTRLTRTLREYLENRYKMQALESTTGQINEELRRRSEVSESWRSKLRDLLQVADLVKFAKAEPAEVFHTRVLNEAIAFVEETREAEEEAVNDTEEENQISATNE